MGVWRVPQDIIHPSAIHMCKRGYYYYNTIYGQNKIYQLTTEDGARKKVGKKLLVLCQRMLTCNAKDLSIPWVNCIEGSSLYIQDFIPSK